MGSAVMMKCFGWVGALGALLFCACSADTGYVDERFYPCQAPAECGQGWGCLRASPYATDFCAPRCDATTCDGVCVGAGDGALCLRGCHLQEDGNTSGCPGEGFACIRRSVARDEGICYPVTACTDNSDCPAGEVCPSELVGLTEAFETDNLYCVPAPDEEGACPPRTLAVELDEGSLCLASCDPPDTRCPPGFGCLRQAELVSEDDEEIMCFPGIYGVPCDDDSNCTLGTCEDTGAPGRQCTLSCDEAARLAGGCQGLPSLGRFAPALAFECDAEAGGDDGGGLCVTRSGIGFPCTTPDSEAYACAEGLQCRSFPSGDGGVTRRCSRDCVSDEQCNRTGRSGNYCTDDGVGGSSCLPKGGFGATCSAPRQCLSGGCVAGFCTGGS